MSIDAGIVTSLAAQRIELPSWAFGNSGTRFKVFAQAGVPRSPYEKIADAAQVHKFTGVAPTVALSRGLDPDPMGAYARSGYAERIVTERVGGQAAGWGA